MAALDRRLEGRRIIVTGSAIMADGGLTAI